MASGKRASMREGPLAALFRRTDEMEPAPSAQTGQPEQAAPAEQPATPRVPEPERLPGVEAPTAGASGPVAQQPAEPVADVPPATAAGAARREVDPLILDGPKDPPTHPRETGYPHPSLAEAQRAAEREAERAARAERRARLDRAFAEDLPEDILAPERPAEPEPAPTVADVDPFARSAEPGPTLSSAEANGWGINGVSQPVIRVVGVGGAGVNAVNRMVEAEVQGVEFLAINTDLQSLQQSTADITLHIGPQVTRGLGAGSNPELGRQAAMEEYDKIKSLLKGSDMVFIAAGAGGGTGTGAAPIVARIAREIGALTVGIITKPFGFEGSRRAQTGDEGIALLHDEVDTLIVVPNNRLLSVLDKRTSMVDAFRVADDVLRQGVQGVSDLVTLPGIINLDFADVRTIMSDAGVALLGIGMGVGEQRALQAAEQAVASPLLETSMDGARSILLSITGGSDLSLWEVNEAAKAVAAAAHPDANIIFGAMVDEKMDDNQVWITVVATRYSDVPKPRSDRRLDEPIGEPRVERRTPPRERITASRGSGGRVADVDVPEFLPRG
jgi:cell division protein FtsZ